MLLKLRTPWRHLAGPAILFVFSLLFCWKILLTNQYTWLDGPDLAHQVLPWFQFQAGEWHQGHFPLWDPYHWAGQPLLGQAQPGAAYPLNWILFSLPLHNGWISQKALHWYFMLIHYLAALFCYWLCRDLERSRTASILAGCVFAFGGFIGTNDWPQMLNGAIWTPLVFLFLFRAAGGKRPWTSAGLSGGFLGVAWLSGHHQIPIFVTLAAGGTWLWYIFKGRRINSRMLAAAMVFLVVMVLVSGLQSVPAYEYGKLAKRWVGVDDPIGWDQPVPYNVHAYYSFSPVSLLGIAFQGMHRHVDPFLGVLATMLALFGIHRGLHNVTLRILLSIALLSMVFAFGGFTFLQGALYGLLPLVEKARSPGNAVFLFNFSFAVLSSFGIDYLRHTEHLRYTVLLRWTLLICGGFVLSSAFLLSLAGKSISDERIMVTAFLCLVSAGAIAAFTRESISAAGMHVVLLICILFELSTVFGFNWGNWNDKNHVGFLRSVPNAADSVAFLRTRVQPLRVDVDDKLFPFNLGDWYGVETLGGYLASLTTNLTRMETYSQRAQQLFAVGYSIGKEPRFPDQKLLFEGKNGVKVYESAGVFPRTWAVHAVKQLPSPGSFTSFIADPTNDLRHLAALTDAPPPLETCEGAEEVRLVHHESAKVQIATDLKCRGMVILADTWYPGWKATVNGKPAKLYEPYGVLRGVVVEKGPQVIDMVYAPLSVRYGAALTILGFLTMIGLAFVRD